ncbi:hypothetical protein M9Y10_020693 [Tritrichomonas musculus]|uniref:BAR domain-containing protein n=1 Tax=Tritrichomonas musculus TaxID=1915356 RepID=A0ABR2HGB9_9EUKA
MQKQIDEYKLSPKNELILQDRMHQVDELERNIEETRQVFAKYIESGNEMCQNVNKLVKNFENLIGPDKSLSPVINILTKFATLMTDHYKLVQESIIDKIDMFTNSDIRQAEEDGKAANKEYSSYSKLLDSYVSVPTKKRSQNNEFHDLQAKLLAQNWMAIKSNFSFSRSLGLIERKRVLEMTSYVCFF